MKRPITPAYTFTPGSSTLNLSGISGFNVANLFAVIDLKTGALIYAPLAGYGYSALSGTTLTLQASMVGLSAGDPLLILYDDGGKPAEDATVAAVVTGITSLITAAGVNHTDALALHTDIATTLHSDLAAVLAKQPTAPALDGADITGSAMPAGGSGIRGWLSAIYKALTGGAPNAATILAAGSLSANNDAVTVSCDGMPIIMVRVPISAATGTAIFEATMDPLSGSPTWDAVNVKLVSGGTVAGFTNGPAALQVYEFSNIAYTGFRVRATSGWSAPIGVKINAGNAAHMVRAVAPASDPVSTTDNANKPFSDWPTIVPNDSTIITGASSIAMNVTVAGNIVMQSTGGNSITWPVPPGPQTLPFAPAKLMATGTTATATYYKLVQ